MNTVDDIKLIEAKGPWQSKSGGNLDVLFSLSQDETLEFLGYNNPEFGRIMKETGYNIKGLRSYTVSNIPKGSVGGKEWHKARSEYLYAPSGSATVQCIDLAGDEKTFTVTSKQAIIIPPGILHTYTALEDNTKLQVICNTLFIPDEPGTHDSFLPDEFYKLIEKTKNASSH